MKSPIYPEIEMKQIVKHGITIDYCPKSGGVWLDKGELEKLISFTSRQEENFEDNVPFGEHNQTPRSRRDLDEDFDDDYRHHHKKRRKEGVLGDIFDFF